MNAVLHNRYTAGWGLIGTQVPRPRAILSISAHWFVPEPGVTISTAPRTIHDFGGFPPGLYQVQYPGADIPVVQLSVDESQPAPFHFEIGRKLAPRRQSGNA